MDQWENANVEFSGFPDYLDAMHKALDNVVVMEEPADGVGEYLLTCNTMAEYQVLTLSAAQASTMGLYIRRKRHTGVAWKRGMGT